MLKDIFKLCKTNNIHYTDNEFVCNGVKVSYLKFISYINKNRFIVGLNKSINLAEKELFQKTNNYDE